MSPSGSTGQRGCAGFPRVSGDEPVLVEPVGHETGFSPRERGCAVNRAVTAAQDGVFPA